MNPIEAINQHLVKDVFNCEVCQLQFAYKSSLVRHVKNGHNNDNKVYAKHLKKDGLYLCKVCGVKYKHSRDLKNHLKKKHNDDEELKEDYQYSTLVNKRQCRDMTIASGIAGQLKANKNIFFKDVKVTSSTKITIHSLKSKIPILGSLDLDDFFESYLIAE